MQQQGEVTYRNMRLRVKVMLIVIWMYLLAVLMNSIFDIYLINICYPQI